MSDDDIIQAGTTCTVHEDLTEVVEATQKLVLQEMEGDVEVQGDAARAGSEKLSQSCGITTMFEPITTLENVRGFLNTVRWK